MWSNAAKCLFISIFSVVLFLQSNTLFAQVNAAELNSADKKKLQSVEKDLEKASKIFNEADKMYADVVNRSAELTFEESDKLNNKAVLKQIEAEKIKYAAEKSRYDVYATRVELFWLRYTGNLDRMVYARALDNGAKGDYASALELWREYETTTDNLMRLSKIHDANEYMVKAGEKMKQAFEICANPPLTDPEPPVSEPVAEPAGTVSNLSTDSSTIGYAGEAVSEPSVSQTETDLPVAPPTETTESDVSPAAADGATNNQSYTQNAEPEVKPAEIYVPVAEPEHAPASVAEDKTDAGYARNKVEEKPAPKPAPLSTNITITGNYRVQIAASRVPLCTEQLQEIYAGNEQIAEELINEWYKYSIGPFSDYDQAARFRDICGVRGAFVVQR